MMDRKFLEKNGVDVAKGLELLGDMDMYNDTMEEYYKEIQSKYRDLKKYKEKDDMSNYAIVVHSIKSDSKYLGFTKLAELAYDHELKSKDNDSKYIGENFDSLDQEINRIIGIIKEYLGKE